MKTIAAVLLLLASAAAADFQPATVLDVRMKTLPNNSALGRWAASDGGSMVIPNTVSVIDITVTIGDLTYSARYKEQRHFKASDFTIGDSTQVRIDGDKLIMKGSDGKEVKGKIWRKERVTVPQA